MLTRSSVTRTLLLACLFSLPVPGQNVSPITPPSAPDSKQPAANSGAADSEPAADKALVSERPLKDQAWELLLDGTKDPHTTKRATAVRVLSLLKGESRATTLASHALDDDKFQVRVAAALALGELRATSSIPKLKTALEDKEPVVVLAAAHSLVLMKVAEAYEVYYEILSGERRSNKGLVAGELDTLKDPKKMAMLGFQEGIGFVPFAGIGYTAIRTIMKDDSSPVRAAAAKVLADDTESSSESALIQAATGDKSEIVRTAALDALAKRGDPVVLPRIATALSDEKDPVKYTAAAAILHLNDIATRKNHKKK
jgi:HEAT repeat protein